MKISLPIALCVAALLSTPIFAQDVDPLRGKIKELEERARNAKEQGHDDEARGLMEQLGKVRAEIHEREQKSGGDKLETYRRKVEELHKAGKHEEAEQLEQRLRGIKEKQGYPDRKDSSNDSERRQHVMEAIKHLHAAGLHEPAGRIEQMLREQAKKAEREHQEKPEQQIQRAIHDIQEQIAKMARNIEELRQQIGRQHSDSEHHKD